MRRYEKDPEYKKEVDADKRARAEAMRKADPPVTLFDIVIPIAPFGIPGLLLEAYPPLSPALWRSDTPKRVSPVHQYDMKPEGPRAVSYEARPLSLATSSLCS